MKRSFLFVELDLIFLIFYFMNDLLLNDMIFVLGADMDANMSIEIHKICQTINFEEKKVTDGPI